MSTAATHATARRTFYLRRSVHVAIAGADHALCGMNLVGAIDTEFDASCADCLAHTFEQQPLIWASIEPIGDAVTFTGLPESTTGFAQTDRVLELRTRYYNAGAVVLGANQEVAEQQARVEALRTQLAAAEQTLNDLQGVALAARDDFAQAEDEFIG